MTLSAIPFLLFVVPILSADPPLYPAKNPLPDHFKPWYDPLDPRTRPARHHILSDEVLDGLMKGIRRGNEQFLEALNGLAQTLYGVSVLESLDVLDVEHLEMWKRMVQTLLESAEEVSELSRREQVEGFVRDILGWDKNTDPSVILERGSVDVILGAISVSGFETRSVIQVYLEMVSEYCLTKIDQATYLMRVLDETPRFILNKIQRNRDRLGAHESLPELVDGVLKNDAIFRVPDSVVGLVRKYPYILPELTTFDLRSLIDIFSHSSFVDFIEVGEFKQMASKFSADQIDSLAAELKNEHAAIIPPQIYRLFGVIEGWSAQLKSQTVGTPG